MDPRHVAPRAKNQNKLCCCRYRPHHHPMFLEDRGIRSLHISSMQKHLSQTRRNMIRIKIIHLITQFDLDLWILASYQSFLRLHWDFEELFYLLGLFHTCSYYILHLKNFYLPDQSGMLASVLKEFHGIQWNSLCTQQKNQTNQELTSTSKHTHTHTHLGELINLSSKKRVMESSAPKKAAHACDGLLLLLSFPVSLPQA